MDRRRFLGVSLGLASLSALGCAAPWAGRRRRSVLVGGGRRARLRDLGIVLGELPPGALNAITDVPGVRVGHVTLIRGEGRAAGGEGVVRTGVTAVLPHAGDLTRQPVEAADLILNGNGELLGTGYLRSSGRLGSPILFTDTASVGAVFHGALGWMLARSPGLLAAAPHAEPVVGETWAGSLDDDSTGTHVRADDAVQALESAASGPVAEGCVGGGTGMRAFGFKAGIGTASRRVTCADRQYTVGVLVQANFGVRDQLRIDGVPVGRRITDLLPEKGSGGGTSLLVAVATDAPLLSVQLRRLCQRAALGMARTGGISSHGSGDLVVAFSTGRLRAGTAAAPAEVVNDERTTPLHQGTVEATEEAILNSLAMATTMTGRNGNTIHALPLDRLVEVMREYGRLK